MIGLVRDRDLESGKPIVIVYKINGRRASGFILTMDEECIVRPYRECDSDIEYGEEFQVGLFEIMRFVKNNEKENLYNYLLDKMIGDKLDY
jgi:hypothetical protein